MAELEVRVQALEGTAADHETRISATETDVSGRSHTHIFIQLMLFLMSSKVQKYHTMCY